MSRVQELVDTLGLAPHPEGGHYRETFRSATAVDPLDGRPRRSALTGIYCLYAAGEVSRWHRVESDEIWTHLEGGPLRLWRFDPEAGTVDSVLVGPLGPECEPQRVVPAGIWQAAEPTGAYALGACFVGPGFDFDDFRMLDADAEARAAIQRLDPALLRFA